MKEVVYQNFSFLKEEHSSILCNCLIISLKIKLDIMSSIFHTFLILEHCVILEQ